MKTLRFSVFVLILCGCMRTGGEEDETLEIPSRVDSQGRVVLDASERETLDLETAVVRSGRLEALHLRFGRVLARPEETSFVVAPVLGRLEAPLVALGDRVARGQPLALLHPLLDTASQATFEVQNDELAGKIAASKVRIDALKAEAKRVETLVASELAIGADEARANAEAEAEEARLDSLERAAETLTSSTSESVPLEATADGVVVELDAEPGKLLAPGETLARLLRTGPLWIDLTVPLDDPIGSSYRIHGPTGPIRASLLVRGALAQGVGTRTYRLLVPSEAAHPLLPDSVLAVDVVRDVPGLLVPTDAVVRRGAQDWVFVEVSAGVFQPHEVEIGARGETEVAVVEGLSEGATVVVRGAMALLSELALGSARARHGDQTP